MEELDLEAQKLTEELRKTINEEPVGSSFVTYTNDPSRSPIYSGRKP